MHRTRGIGLAATVAAILAFAIVAPAALGTQHATPDLYEVAILGTYSELRETVPPAGGTTGAAHELVDIRWQARSTTPAPLKRVGRQGAAITARLTGTVSLYRRLRSELIAVGGVGCLHVASGDTDPSRPAARLTLDLAGTVTTPGASRLNVSLGRLPVVVRGSQRCRTVTPDPGRSEAVALRPLLLPPESQLGKLLHVPASAVRRGRPFDVERSVVLEQPGPAGSGTTLSRRWSLRLVFSPCATAGC
jgi:hypothetical protein